MSMPPPPPPPGQYGAPQPVGAPPPNNLTLAIVSTVIGLCGCFGVVFGIIAIVMATQVQSKWAQGDAAGALQASARAKMFAYIALAIGIIGLLINVILAATGNSTFRMGTT